MPSGNRAKGRKKDGMSGNRRVGGRRMSMIWVGVSGNEVGVLTEL